MGSRIVAVLVFGCWAALSNAVPFAGIPYKAGYQAEPEVTYPIRSDDPNLNKKIGEVFSKTSSYILVTPKGASHVGYNSPTAISYDAAAFSKEYPHLHKKAVAAQNDAIKRSNDMISYRQSEKQKLQDRTCREGDGYKLYQQGLEVVNSVFWLNQTNVQLERNAKIERASGTRNLGLRYELHDLLERAKSQRDFNFSKYKRMGGVASSPTFVERLNKNPCANLKPVMAESPIPFVDESSWMPEIYTSGNLPLSRFEYKTVHSSYYPQAGLVLVLALVRPDGSVDAFIGERSGNEDFDENATYAVERISYNMDSNVEGIPKAFFVYIPVIYHQGE